MKQLTLPKSRLALRDGELVKSGPDDVVIARFPIEQIVRIGIQKTRQYGMALSIVAILSALAVVAHLHVSSPAWSWIAIIACVAGSALVIMGIEGRELVIETPAGKARYPVADLFEEAEGFVLSLNALLGTEREGVDRTSVRETDPAL